jgi:N-methylhydantoinase B
MRAEIAQLPDGRYSAEDWLDNDGIVEEPLKIALDLTIAGERMTLDFSPVAGTSGGARIVGSVWRCTPKWPIGHDDPL